MAPALGTVLNQHDVKDRISITIKGGQNVKAGLVYEFAADDWRNAPTDGTKKGRELYWLDRDVDLSNKATTVKKKLIAYGTGALVIGKADGAMAANVEAKASETASHDGQFQANAKPARPVIGDTSTVNQATAIEDAIEETKDWLEKTASFYKGHYDEYKEAKDITDAVDEETDLVFEIRRGY